MNIADVPIKGFCALAPMAGVADSAFREICVSFGAAYTVGEMVSAKGLTMNDKKSRELLKLSDTKKPSAVQLFGSEPAVMASAAQLALDYKPDVIDINMGCPAPKVTKNGCGSALMKNTALAGKIIRAVCDAVKLPVTVKFRTGWDENSKNYIEFAKAAEANGASAICIHGKTKEQMYAPPVDLDAIKAVKRAVKIPVIGNGDIFTPHDAKRMYEYTECDFIMLGRGALGAPWIFESINSYLGKGVLLPLPGVERRMEIMLEHSKKICELHGDNIGMLEIRKHALWYTKGLKGSAKLRNEFSNVKKYSELYLLAEKVIDLSEK